jgi:hypothetical protein
MQVSGFPVIGACSFLSGPEKIANGPYIIKCTWASINYTI